MRGIFGRRSYGSPFSATPPTDYAAAGGGPPIAMAGKPAANAQSSNSGQQPRRGLFGRMFDPQRLSLAFYAAGGGDWTSELARRREEARYQENLPYERALRGLQMRGAKLDALDSDTERQQAAEQRAARERYRARLPAEQQDEFALDPEGVLERNRPPEYSDFGPIGGGFYGQRNVRTGEYGSIVSPPRGGRGGGGGGLADLSAQDQTRLRDISEAASTARAIQQEMTRFSALNREEPTGELSGLIPSNLFRETTGANRSEMRGITDRLVPMLNAAVRLPGAASERDAARLTSAAPNVSRVGNANQAIINGYQQATQNAIDYSEFAEQYAAAQGTVVGIDTSWNSYLDANPIHDSEGNVRTNRPSFREWLAAGQPDLSQDQAPNSRGSLEEQYRAIQEAMQRARGDMPPIAGRHSGRTQYPRSPTGGAPTGNSLSRGVAVREGAARIGYRGTREVYRNGRWIVE